MAPRSTPSSRAIPRPPKATPETEASGYAYAKLDRTGQSVAVVNKTGKQANTLVVRASIPDAPQGGGIDASLNLYVDGTYRQAITISSKQAWNYRHAATNVGRGVVDRAGAG
ncbi:hypothetical protein [Streptomyces sp. NPDC056669]|uniref:hypothetical protein n=1 Tax=Streptomyces sp. NPDC056669 TaxID=3345903 RepID=UPI00368C7D41